MRPEAPERRPRRNHEIRVPKVRLIGEEGQQIGIVWLREAIDAAEEAGLDLIEVAPDADPPVCRIMDWGRFRYEQKQRERDQRRKQKGLEVKGLRLRPTTGENDFQVTRRKAEMFLREGHRVRVEVRFRGREITHRELGHAILLKLAQAVDEVGQVEQSPAMEGRKMFLVIGPRPEAIGTKMSAEDEKALAEDQAREAEEGIDDDLDDELDDLEEGDETTVEASSEPTVTPVEAAEPAEAEAAETAEVEAPAEPAAEAAAEASEPDEDATDAS